MKFQTPKYEYGQKLYYIRIEEFDVIVDSGEVTEISATMSKFNHGVGQINRYSLSSNGYHYENYESGFFLTKEAAEAEAENLYPKRNICIAEDTPTQPNKETRNDHEEVSKFCPKCKHQGHIVYSGNDGCWLENCKLQGEDENDSERREFPTGFEPKE